MIYRQLRDDEIVTDGDMVSVYEVPEKGLRTINPPSYAPAKEHNYPVYREIPPVCRPAIFVHAALGWGHNGPEVEIDLGVNGTGPDSPIQHIYGDKGLQLLGQWLLDCADAMGETGI